MDDIEAFIMEVRKMLYAMPRSVILKRLRIAVTDEEMQALHFHMRQRYDIPPKAIAGIPLVIEATPTKPGDYD